MKRASLSLGVVLCLTACGSDPKVSLGETYKGISTTALNIDVYSDHSVVHLKKGFVAANYTWKTATQSASNNIYPSIGDNRFIPYGTRDGVMFVENWSK